jgi:IclR family acetate operon transcriptional repressor
VASPTTKARTKAPARAPAPAPAASAADAQAAGSRSALRSLGVFEAFRNARRPLSLSELARLTDIPVSTCHGVMRALEDNGYLYVVGGRDLYPTRRLWEMADEIRAHDPIAMRLEPALTALRDQVDETVVLGSRLDDSVLYLMVLESRQSIRYSARAGERKPLHSSSVGKALLGGLEPQELDHWLAGRTLERVTERTITSAAKLRADLVRGRTRGWYGTRGENVRDVMAVAATLQIGTTALGVAIAGPVHRIQPIESALGERLARCVRQIEATERR